MEWLNIEELEMLTANTLLDWMEDDGGFNEFFRNYIITPTPDNNRCYTIEAIEGVQVFDGSDEALKKYIKSNVEQIGRASCRERVKRGRSAKGREKDTGR